MRVLRALPTTVLPPFRRKFTEPFTVTGVDFTGRLLYKSGLDQISNAYVALFTCESTRAVDFGRYRWAATTPKRFHPQKCVVDTEKNEDLFN